MDKSRAYFDYLDYIIFAAMLLISALIGVYFAFFAKVKQNTTSEYLMGGKTMGIFPISMSLIASYISGISILGMPAEIYTYGTQFWMVIISVILGSIMVAIAYLPVFYQLQITSSYEYLNLRFNNTVRLLGSVLFLIKMLLYIPIVIYVPALAFSQVTGINLHLVTPAICVVCIFYTTLGGLKAVVWSDALQTVVMFGALVAVTLLGTTSIGGLEEVVNRNEQGDRLEFFNFDWDPTIRNSFWTVTIGTYFSWIASCAIDQAMVQRCLAMPTLASAKVTIFILVIGIMLVVSLCCYMGMVIFAAYYKCDPITRGIIAKSDQLLPYFVMQIATVMPGLPGLFVSGVFSAALSSMSTGLNSMTGVIFEDLIKPRMKKPLSEAHASLLMKINVVIMGIVCVALVFVVEKMGTLIQVCNSLVAITDGPSLGIFTLGMFFPFVNSKGALLGGLISVTLVGWISLGTQANIANGIITFPQKPLSLDHCDANWLQEYLNIALTTDVSHEPPVVPFVLFRLSYMYYTALGAITAIVVGVIISLLTGRNKGRVLHKDLFSPVIQKFLKNDDCDIKTVARQNDSKSFHNDNCIKLDQLNN